MVLHVHTHDDQCPFDDVDFTDAELDAASVTGVLARGDKSVPFADLAVLRVRDDWVGDGRTNAGTWLSTLSDTGTTTATPTGLRRGSVLMPPAAFFAGPGWDRHFGFGAFGMDHEARAALTDPGRLTWGFELETQTSAGAAHGGEVRDVSDPEAWVTGELENPRHGVTMDHLRGWFDRNRTRLLRAEPMATARAEVATALRQHARDNGVPGTPASKWLKDRLPTLDIGSDGTVSGFEIRTRGGLTPADFDAAARAVCSVPHTVDTGCSFHVHVKLPGRRLTYSQDFHRLLLEWLVCHVDEFPAPVLTRLADSGKRDRYFRPLLDEDKYRAIRHHPSGTWEFRLFGNVADAESALKCRALTEAAVRHALRVAAGEAQPLLPGAKAEFERKCLEAFRTGRPPQVAQATERSA